MLNVNTRLAQLEAEGRQIRVGIVGAGQMGTGLVTQITRIRGMRVAAVADIDVQRAAAAFSKAGIPPTGILALASQAGLDPGPGIEVSRSENRGRAVALANDAVLRGRAVALDQAAWLAAIDAVDVVVEATGYPEVGARIAETAIRAGKHIIMLNAETDATAGFILKRMAQQAGVIYTGAAGDEPAAAKELYDFADALGFQVLVAGKGKNNPLRPDATPDQLAGEAARKGASVKMLTSFVDGTKTMVEMTVLANATGLVPDCPGMHGLSATLEQVLDALRLTADGGPLHAYGIVEFINGIAPGVFVVIQSDQPVVVETLRYLKMGEGPRFLLYRPYHLTSLETPLSVARAMIYGEPTIAPGDRPVADTVAVAKKDLQTGDTLDGLGGYTVYGTIITAAAARERRALPVGLAAPGTRVLRPVAKGSILAYGDVELPPDLAIARLRREQDTLFYGEVDRE